MTSPTPGLGARLAAFITRWPGTIALVAVLLGVLSFQGARQLGINQELRAMLPDHAATVVRLDAVAERLGNQSDLYVAIRSPDRAANLEFAAKIAAALRQRDDIRYVLFRRDPTFFKANALLYADLTDLLELRTRVIDTIQAHVRREMSAFPEDVPDGQDTLGLDEKELRREYNLDDDPDEYFESDEGRVVVVRARPLRPNTDIAFTRNLFAGVQEAITAANPTTYPGMDVAIEGSYALHTRLASDLQRDIINGSLAALGMLLLTVAAYFRGLRSVPLVLTPLLIAACFALACAAWLYGYLNLVSAFIFAVQLGLGIDFATHMLARYRDELARGLAHREAIATAIATTGVSTAGGALSTAFSFLLLVLAEFRGFTQFGVVACIGIIVAYLAAILVLPALCVLFDRVWPWKVRQKPPAGSFTRGDPKPVPRLALAVLAAILAVSAFGAARLSHLEFEYDLNKLGVPDTETPEQRTRRLQFRSAVGNIQSTDPAIALTSDLAQTRELHRQLQALHEWKPSEVAAITGLPQLSPDPESTTPPPEKKPPPAKPVDAEEEEDEDDITEPDDPKFVALQQVAAAHAVVAPKTLAALKAYPPERLREMDDLLASVLSIYSFIPDLQAEKLLVIRDIRDRLNKKRGAFTEADEQKLKSWDRYLQVDREITVADLPDWVRVQFTDTEGQVGRFVAFWHNGPTADYKHAKRIFADYFTLTTTTGEVPVVANYYVIPEIVDTIRGDGPLVMTAVIGVLLATAFIMFRSVAHTLLVFLTVAAALLWLAALFPALGWKLNLFNLIALPLLVGMGQDDSLHLIHRYREEGPGSLKFVLHETGGAVFLTTLTTVIGFSSMLFVSHQGLRSLGWTSVLGMTLCLVSSVLIVPAGLRVLEWLRHRGS